MIYTAYSVFIVFTPKKKITEVEVAFGYKLNKFHAYSVRIRRRLF